MKTWITVLTVFLLTAPAFAQQQPQLSPADIFLRNLNRIRTGIEQEEDKEAERSRVAGQAAFTREIGTSLGEMRGRVSDNMRNIREPFRCLDVDVEGNSAPVVVVCGNNSGAAAAVQRNTNNSGNTFSLPAGAILP